MRRLKESSSRHIVSKITVVLVFKVPDVSNPEKWANRVVSNLLYYQTNYLLSAAIIFAFVSYIHPQEMALGMVTVVSCEIF